MQFIGVEAYQAAGGVIRRDLFSDDDTAFAQDAELLERLVSEKLAGTAKEVAAEGWKWVEVISDVDYSSFSMQHRLYPECADLTDEEQAELDSLAAEYDSLVDSDDEDCDRLNEIESRMGAIEARAHVWSAGKLAVAGAVVSLLHNGDVHVVRGLVRNEDAKLAAQLRKGIADVPGAPKPEFSSGLIESLTAHKSAALSAALCSNAEVALAAVVHALILRAFYRNNRDDSCLKLSIGGAALPKSVTAETCKGLAGLHTAVTALREQLPGDPDELWHWCRTQSQEALLNVLAVLVGASVDAVQRKADRCNAPRLLYADDMANALSLDMTDWFTPTADNYFSRVNRSQILEAIDEAKGSHAPAFEKLKKSELAANAERLLAGTGWLPVSMRVKPTAD
jgi:ParB family chromosome partitioning protein